MRQAKDFEIKEFIRLKTKRKLNKLRVAIYARKSSEDVSGMSIPTQIKNCKDYVRDNSNHLELKEVFSDENASGMFIDGRDDFQKMIKLVEEKDIDAVLVLRFDRFSRSTHDMTNLCAKLKYYDCLLIAGDDIGDNTPVGEFARNVLWSTNQLTARTAASSSMKSLINTASQSKSAGGIAPYGYQLVNQQFVIMETERLAVELLFTTIAQGGSYRDVIKAYEALGIRTRKGNIFSYSTLNAMLKNEKYYGTYVYNRENGKKKKNRVLIETFKEVRNESTVIQPIIKKELFDDANAAMKSKKNFKAINHPKHKYLLGGIITCKSCGKKMCGTSAKSGGKKKLLRAYGCNNHRARHGSTCSTKNINADYIENLAKEIIFQTISQYFVKGELKNSVFDILIKKEEYIIKHLERLLLSSQQKSNSLVTMITNTNNALLKKKYEDTLTSILQLEDIQTNKKLDVEKKIAKYTAIKNDDLSIVTLSKDTLFSDYDTSKKLMRLFIQEIQVTNTNVTFIFKN